MVLEISQTLGGDGAAVKARIDQAFGLLGLGAV